MASELSAGDIMALTKGDGDNWMNNPFIYLVWLALLGGGNGFFGGGGDNGALTRAAVYDGNLTQETFRSLSNIYDRVSTGFCNTDGKIAAANFDTARGIDALRYEMSKSCCDLSHQISADGDATRALITQNTIQDLRDKLAAKDRELMQSNFLLSQQAQNATIISALTGANTVKYCGCTV